MEEGDSEPSPPNSLKGFEQYEHLIEQIGESPRPEADATPQASEEEDDLFPPDKRRSEEVKEALHWIFIHLMYLIAIVVSLVAVFRAAHLAMPESWHWLSEAQIGTIDSWIIGGFIASSASQYIKERTSSD